jgi:energy-converting hydrogenase Eha subunit H
LWFLADGAGEKTTTMMTTMVFGDCFEFCLLLSKMGIASAIVYILWSPDWAELKVVSSDKS